VCSACFSICFGSMAVGAADLALPHLGYYSPEWYTPPTGIAKAELFVPDVVKLKDDGVLLPAVHAGVILQILVQPHAHGIPYSFPAHSVARLNHVFVGLLVPALSQLLPHWVTLCHGRCIYYRSYGKNIPPKVYAKNIPPRGYGTKKVPGGVSMRRMVGMWHE